MATYAQPTDEYQDPFAPIRPSTPKKAQLPQQQVPPVVTPSFGPGSPQQPEKQQMPTAAPQAGPTPPQNRNQSPFDDGGTFDSGETVPGTAPTNPYPNAPAPTGGGTTPPTPTGQELPPSPATTKYNTDGFATPGYVAKNPFNAPPGYDQGKWADTGHQTPKYAIGKIMQEAADGAGNLADPAKRKLAIDRITQAYPGAQYNGKDKLTIPGVGTFDVFQGASSGHYGITWQPLTDQDGRPFDQGGPPIERGQGPPLTPTPGSEDPTGGGVPGAVPGGITPGPQDPMRTPTNPGGGIDDPQWQELYDELLRRSKQSLDVNPNDPIIKGQVDASNAVANRNRLTQMQEAAERGGPYATGELQNQNRASSEAVQLQMGAMQSELMGREVAARRQEIAQALQQRQGMLTVEEQSRLRQLDQELERQQMVLADRAERDRIALADRQLDLSKQNSQKNWDQMDWERKFKDRGWESDLAQTNWQNERDLWY